MNRLEKEQEVLRQHFPDFRIQDPFGPQFGAIGRLRSNAGNVYALWISMQSFPALAPAMYVVAPHPLLDAVGTPLHLHGARHELHTMPPDQHGHPQICHYNDRFWHPKVTLYKIVFKARLWLEAYEQHRNTGLSIGSFLATMK